MNPDIKNKFANLKEEEDENEEEEDICLNFNGDNIIMNNKAAFESDKWTVRKWSVKCI